MFGTALFLFGGALVGWGLRGIWQDVRRSQRTPRHVTRYECKGGGPWDGVYVSTNGDWCGVVTQDGAYWMREGSGELLWQPHRKALRFDNCKFP